jgi:iron(III) transport system permease protein
VIVAAYAVLFTPIVMKQTIGLVRSQDERLSQAAQLAGAGPLSRFFHVRFPALLPGLRSGLLICVIIAAREIPISLMLYSSGQETLGVLLFGMQSQSYGLEMTSALSLLIIVAILAGRPLVDGKRSIHGTA